ncbi:transcription elongation factor GreA [Candidatus Falkowbacteria bacterium RIFOXYB2_FULL_38_15]|uniref:Transcription elongation factor GreA n=1 Tax=Candidatus Falkowbacteria bacterium RIFOXYA2_FULL_38_12 TaxID=1797993 RepID=A0A1F5S3P7_9BACT|nr:MAG: transcription elongation factor GreA [Candidatus Falkowbacteria bacterium RIFOXYA2_FULL_38_12]OGF33751.1 MAG: transcription elongation factor GreA [Candidatus Falkowbacteria bacterium RIFOXYB2_FULL_38_15]OGF42380.1 MAG: transcription elongation factor GreA [Candidatus Falkowbacteria bacterium RIFOXYD2_FULL_39_16]
MQEKKIYVSEEGLEKFKKELDGLVNFRRKEITERIEEAIKMGDLSENAEYDAAKNEQAFVEGRIAELQDLIRRAEIINQGKSRNNDHITVGSLIKVKNNGDTLEYTIVGVAEADPVNGKISNESPLGKAFLGKRVGDKIDVTVPKGILTYTILEIG